MLLDGFSSLCSALTRPLATLSHKWEKAELKVTGTTLSELSSQSNSSSFSHLWERVAEGRVRAEHSEETPHTRTS